MQIITVDATNDHLYHAYVVQCESALLYHSLVYRDFLVTLIGARAEYYLAQDEAGQVRGILPLMWIEGEYGKVYNSLPYYGSNGGILAADQPAETSLLDHYNRLISRADVAAATYIESPLSKRDSLQPAHDLTDYRIGQLTQIDYRENHAQSLMDSFHLKTRNLIRKAQKSGIQVSVQCEELEFLREVHVENMAALHGLPKSKTFFDLLAQRFQANRDYELYIARYQGEPVAALLLFYYNRTVEYYTPVIRHAYRHLQPLSLLIYEAMLNASQHGYRWWNWGGTWPTQESLHHFKKRWGTRDIAYTYYSKVNQEQLLHASKQELLAGYPNFFVVPFHSLKSQV